MEVAVEEKKQKKGSSEYKQTEVGVIPDSWKVDKFKNVTKVITCGLASTPDYVNPSRGYPFLSSTNVKEGKIRWENYKFISEKLHKRLYRNNPPEKSDILYSRVGSIGEAAVIEVDEEFSIYVSLTLIKPQKDILYSHYLKCLLNSYYYKQRAHTEVYKGGGVGNLNVGVVRNYPIVYPPTLKEQRAIADALSDVDELIASLDELIEKKKKIKKGAMQELLTGKTRLPGFSGEWEEFQLGEVAEFSKGKGLPKKDISQDGEKECIHYGQLFTHYQEKIKEIISRTNKLDNTFLSKSNDVLMPSSDVTPNGLATASCLKKDGVILGGDILVIRIPDEIINGIFLSYYITLNKQQVLQYVTGTTVYHLYSSGMSNFNFEAPSIDEQNEIVEVLTYMESEIQSLQEKRDKYKKIKQGMRQELLTGKTRLV